MLINISELLDDPLIPADPLIPDEPLIPDDQLILADSLIPPPGRARVRDIYYHLSLLPLSLITYHYYRYQLSLIIYIISALDVYNYMTGKKTTK